MSIINENITKFKRKKCINKMLECIADMKNLRENDGDLQEFEERFNSWDYDLIILDELRFVNDMEDKEDNYIFLETLGIYNNIGMFARKLQDILPHFTEGLTVSAICIGDDLNIDVNLWEGDECKSIHNYVVKMGKLNQIKGSFGCEGYKF